MRGIVFLAIGLSLLPPAMPGSTAPARPAGDVRGDDSAHDDTSRRRLVVIGAGPAERVWLAESLERFRANHLELPDLEVRFSDDPSDCGGHLGTFAANAVPLRVVVCSRLDFVLTHELAHAWAAANLGAEQRNQYLQARRLVTWDDHSVPWGERGTEDAAFMIQQNLMVTTLRRDSHTWEERVAAYELLTGRRSPMRELPPATG